MNFTLLRAPGAPVLRVGHRGAKGHAPENTLASFERGLALGANVVETDVHLSRDGEVVVIHDETVDRTTDGHGPVRDLTVDELQALDAGSWFDPRFTGQRIPTLDEVCAWARERAPLAIEIKNGPIYYPGIAPKVVGILRAYDMLRHVIVISFDHYVLREVKMLAPDVVTGLLYVGRLVDPAAAARAAGADAIHSQWAYTTSDLVQTAHAAGLAVSAWTANDVRQLRRLDQMGVDSIASDFPDLFDQL